MDDKTVRRILSEYGYTDITLFPLEKGYRNESHPFELLDGQKLNLILYKDEPDSLVTIRNADQTSNFAMAAGLPARKTVSTRLIQLKGVRWRKYGAIYTYLPGHTIPWEAYTKDHIKLLGKSLSDLHAVLQSLSHKGYPLLADQYYSLVRAMAAYFSEAGVQAALSSKLRISLQTAIFEHLLHILGATRAMENQQVLHMDFVRSNILFAGEQESPSISGVLDFEKTAVGHPTFDIARTLAFLLVDCKYKSAEQVRKYFLYSGYQKRGSKKLLPATVADGKHIRPLLEELVDLFLIYDFYKFLRHNPYESLPENEHFMRTVALLLEHRLVGQLKVIQ